MDGNTKILPFKYPMITTYHGVGSLFAILENYPDAMKWIYSNYIQIYGYIRNDNFELLQYPGFEAMRMCPWINFSLLSRELIHNIQDSIVDFFINCIESNNYIYVCLDEFYVNGTFAHNKQHFRHDVFIYGYDKQKKIINLADFTFRGKYSNVNNLGKSGARFGIKMEHRFSGSGSGKSSAWTDRDYRAGNFVDHTYDSFITLLRGRIKASANKFSFQRGD